MAKYPPPPADTAPPVQTARARYEQLETEREPFLTRARPAARLTIPSLVPPAGSSGSTVLPSPWQSVGARGVNNLAAKILLALFPPGAAFFKLTTTEAILDKLKQDAQGDDVESSVQTALSKAERAISDKLVASNIRSTLFEVFKHLIVAGNALLVILPGVTFKFFPLTQYVVKRDLEGNPLEIIAKETLTLESLPEKARALVASETEDQKLRAKKGNQPAKGIDLFTWLSLDETGGWKIRQEVCGQVVPGSTGTYPKGKAAWLPLRWSAVPNEDYGRGHVEEYHGDIFSLDKLSQALVDGASAMAKILFMVNEAGITSKQKIAKAPNLAVIDGDAKDVTILRTDKQMDFSVAANQAEKIQNRLEQAFLLTSSIQRNAERVTAEEIRVMANELESALGGVYSMFAQELQRPVVERVVAVMQKAKELPQFPDKSLIPQIITGLEGLGRSSDLTRLDLLVAGAIQNFGEESVQDYFVAGDYFARRAAALSIGTDGLLRTEDQVQQIRQARAQQALAQTLGPKAIDANAKRDIAAQQAEAPASKPQ